MTWPKSKRQGLKPFRVHSRIRTPSDLSLSLSPSLSLSATCTDVLSHSHSHSHPESLAFFAFITFVALSSPSLSRVIVFITFVAPLSPSLSLSRRQDSSTRHGIY